MQNQQEKNTDIILNSPLLAISPFLFAAWWSKAV